jgi:primosomal protein N' (replication factor Y)
VTVFAEVVFPLPVDRSFQYRVPEILLPVIRPGCRVAAPFGRRMLTGFVVAVVEGPPAGGFELKDIHEVLDKTPSFSADFLRFTKKLSARSFTPWGEILAAALPLTLVPRDRKKVSWTPAGREALEKGTLKKRERKLASFLPPGKALSPAFLAKKMGVKSLSSLLARLETKGVLAVRTVPSGPGKKASAAGSGGTARQLELDFARAAPSATDAVERRIVEGGSGSFYLFGSREAREAAYARLVRRSFGACGRVVYLAPEIGLGEAALVRMKEVLGSPAAVLHSRLSKTRREDEWRKLAEGRADAVVGPRSALLAPLPGLRLIIVDEESDESYTQQEGQLYDAVKGARLRAEEEKAVVVFGSSWPSVEAYHEARIKETLITLESERRKFKCSILDDRAEKTALSSVLKQKIGDRIACGDPIVLFVNRRGYAPLVLCQRCGYSPRCRRCDIALSYHKKDNIWACHYCGAAMPASRKCPECGGTLVERRAKGIEAVEEELRNVFPRVNMVCFDSDAAGRESDRERIVRDFRKGRIPVLLGTRLLAYRTDVPRVRLAGIISPEALLGLSDYRASQKVSGLITQMISFVEDDERAEAVIQTSCPSDLSIRAAAEGDYPAFYEAEIKARRLLSYPPFTHLAEVLLRGANLRSLARKSREFAARLKGCEGEIEVLGPALASVSRVRGLYQVQVILKARDWDDLDKALRQGLEKIGTKRALRLSW